MGFLTLRKHNPPCAGIVLLMTKTLHCNSATSLFLYYLK